MTEPRHFILGAAGHVDHGKTALITALTGTNTDRLKEEQSRGISIELGFAEFDLGGGVTLGVVDMPGHEKFVKQMVSGAGGVDLAFLVVAADEGVMPQTIEHLGILDSLGVQSGVVVITKIDMVDEDFIAVASEEAAELVEGTFLEGKPIVPVSAHAGSGLGKLKDALRSEAMKLPVRAEEGLFRLPVDRVFTMPGAGVIVTGTCWSGRVAVGDKLLAQPGELPVRVREVQVHGARSQLGSSGQRLALALHGIKKDDIARGFQIAAAGAARPTRRIDLRATLMPHYGGVIKNRQRLHVHHAGREVLGRIILLDAQDLGGDSGERSALAQLHLEEELVAARGDRLVLRFYSPVTSIAGGVVLDAAPRPHKRFDERPLAALAVVENGDVGDLFRQNLREAALAGLPAVDAPGLEGDESVLAVGKLLYDRERVLGLATDLAGMLTSYAGRFPLRLGIPKEEARRKMKFKGGAAQWSALCQALGTEVDWVVVDDRICLTPEGPPLQEPLAAAVAEAARELDAFGLDWPGLERWAEDSPVFQRAGREPELAGFLPPEVQRHLTDHKMAVPINNEYIVSPKAFADLLDRLQSYFASAEEMIFATFREVSGLTRKLGIPMLEYLDQTERTVRRGDVRVIGPRLENKE